MVQPSSLLSALQHCLLSFNYEISTEKCEEVSLFQSEEALMRMEREAREAELYAHICAYLCLLPMLIPKYTMPATSAANV